MANKLILLTSEFPFTNSENFLETELNILAKVFDEIQIIAIDSTNKVFQIKVPSNCYAKSLYIEITWRRKLLALSYVFHPLFWREIGIIKKIYKKKISVGIISSMLISLYKASKIKKHSKSLILDSLSDTKIYFYSYWCGDSAVGLAMVQKKYCHVKTFTRIHRWDVYFNQSFFEYLPFRHFICNHLKAIFSISSDGLKHIVMDWKVEISPKFHLSRLGVHRQLFLPDQSSSILKIVSCSNLIAVKQIDKIAIALKRLDGKISVKWIHIGDGPEQKKISEIISTYSSTVEAKLMGRLQNSKVYEFYKEFGPNLFINVSASEGVPVSIMEAMSLGISVIATDVGGNSEIVNSENGCLLIENITDEGLAKAILDYNNLSDSEKFIKREAAYKMWEGNYDANTNYSHFVESVLSL